MNGITAELVVKDAKQHLCMKPAVVEMILYAQTVKHAYKLQAIYLMVARHHSLWRQSVSCGKAEMLKPANYLIRARSLNMKNASLQLSVCSVGNYPFAEQCGCLVGFKQIGYLHTVKHIQPKQALVVTHLFI